MISIIQQTDDAILNFIHTNLQFSILDKVMPSVSWVGNMGSIWIVIAILFILSKKHKTTGFIMIISLVLCVLIGNIALKHLVARIRPCYVHPEIVLLIPRPSDFSFPSGHTMSSFAAATVIILSDKRWGKMAIAMALLIAFSRLYLYVHYPSDIVGGILLGVTIAFISVKISEVYKKYSVVRNKDY